MTNVANQETPETPEKTVERLAALTRIRIPEERKAALAAEFGHVLTYIAQLDELDIAGGGAPALPALHNAFRKDAKPNESGEWTKAVVDAFPAESGNALVVKKILSHD